MKHRIAALLMLSAGSLLQLAVVAHGQGVAGAKAAGAGAANGAGNLNRVPPLTGSRHPL